MMGTLTTMPRRHRDMPTLRPTRVRPGLVRASHIRRDRPLRGLDTIGRRVLGALPPDTSSFGERPRKREIRDELEHARITVQVEHTVPGSPQDERLYREQTRAVLDLLSDIIQRRGETAA
jgi:hypothetical protein